MANEPLDKAKLIAYVFGELEEYEMLKVRKQMETDPQLRREIELLTETSRGLTDYYEEKAEVGLRPDQTLKIFQAAQMSNKPPSKKKMLIPFWWYGMGGGLATAAILLLVLNTGRQVEPKMVADQGGSASGLGGSASGLGGSASGLGGSAASPPMPETRPPMDVARNEKTEDLNAQMAEENPIALAEPPVTNVAGGSVAAVDRVPPPPLEAPPPHLSTAQAPPSAAPEAAPPSAAPSMARSGRAAQVAGVPPAEVRGAPPDMKPGSAAGSREALGLSGGHVAAAPAPAQKLTGQIGHGSGKNSAQLGGLEKPMAKSKKTLPQKASSTGSDVHGAGEGVAQGKGSAKRMKESTKAAESTKGATAKSRNTKLTPEEKRLADIAARKQKLKSEIAGLQKKKPLDPEAMSERHSIEMRNDRRRDQVDEFEPIDKKRAAQMEAASRDESVDVVASLDDQSSDGELFAHQVPKVSENLSPEDAAAFRDTIDVSRNYHTITVVTQKITVTNNLNKDKITRHVFNRLQNNRLCFSKDISPDDLNQDIRLTVTVTKDGRIQSLEIKPRIGNPESVKCLIEALQNSVAFIFSKGETAQVVIPIRID